MMPLLFVQIIGTQHKIRMSDKKEEPITIIDFDIQIPIANLFESE